MKKFLLLCLFLTLAVPGLRADMTGPYNAEGFAAFIVHKGGPLKIQVKLASVSEKKGSAVVAKILDAEEKEVLWDYVKFKGTKILEHDFGGNAPKGIYQIRTSGENYTVDPVAVPKKKYGVMAARSDFNFTSVNQFEDVYFLIPEGAKKLSWRTIGTKIEVTPQEGEAFDAKTKQADVSGKAGQIWNASIQNPKTEPYYRVGFSGMPVILCPDAATARAINGSVEKASDGTVYAHKFQVRIHDWLKSVKPEDLKVDIVDLRTLEAQFRAEPKASGLLGSWAPFSYINFQIEKQNIDPKSPDFGKVPGGASGLALANSLKAPFNPYYGKLEKRMLIAVLPGFLKMKESETWEDDYSNYAGGSALGFVAHSFPFYYGINSVKDEKLKALWFDAEKRFCDRFSMFRVSCENQSSHYPFFYYVIGSTMNLPKYKELAADYIHGMDDPQLNKFMVTGYQQEAYGPDVTYSGLGQCWQALYYRMSGNKEALEGCRKVHNFLAHSCVREPDGKIVCSSNFAHRTEGGWNQAQYGAGRELLKGEVEEAAVFTSGKTPEVDFAKELTPRSYANPAAIGYASGSFGQYMHYYLFPAKRIENPKLPFEKQESFTRNFNDEFVAIRKPGYYLFTYLNGTADGWTKNQRYKTVANPQFPTYRWAAIQGTCVLWFKDYGAFIVGRSFNGNHYHMLRGDLPDGKIAYPDYWEQKSTYSGNRIKSEGKMFQAPGVGFTRMTHCLDNGIRQVLKVNFEKDIKFKSFVEQIPFHEDKADFKVEYHVNGKWDEKPGVADAVRFGGKKKIAVKFDKAYPVERGPSLKGFGSIRIELGKEFKADSSLKMSYTIQPE